MSKNIIYKDEDFCFSLKQDLTPGESNFDLHIHDEYELYCFLSGEADFLIEGNRYHLTPGAILIMRPGEFHQIHLHSTAPYKRFVIMFSQKLISSFDPLGELLIPYHNRPLGRSNLYLPTKFHKISPIDFLNLAAEEEKDTNVIRIKALSSLFMILSRLLVIFRASGDSANDLSPSERIINYINQNLSHDLSLKALSSTFFLSESQLNRIIKRSTNMSIGEYINIKRLHRARELLLAGETASNVYISCGFRDYSTFFRAYKKLFGVNPQSDMKAIFDKNDSSLR